jgi:hypothetical protein
MHLLLSIINQVYVYNYTSFSKHESRGRTRGLDAACGWAFVRACTGACECVRMWVGVGVKAGSYSRLTAAGGGYAVPIAADCSQRLMCRGARETGQYVRVPYSVPVDIKYKGLLECVSIVSYSAPCAINGTAGEGENGWLARAAGWRELPALSLDPHRVSVALHRSRVRNVSSQATHSAIVKVSRSQVLDSHGTHSAL